MREVKYTFDPVNFKQRVHTESIQNVVKLFHDYPNGILTARTKTAFLVEQDFSLQEKEIKNLLNSPQELGQYIDRQLSEKQNHYEKW